MPTNRPHGPSHIIFITPGFPADEADSVCVPPFQAFLLAFKKAQPDVLLRVIALHYPRERKKYSWHGIEVVSLHSGRFKKIKKPLLWWRLNQQLKEWQQEQKIDVIHSLWLSDSTWLAQGVVKKYSIRHIATMMGQDALPANRYLSVMDFSVLRLVALSKKSAKSFHQTTGKEISTIIPWGIDEQQLAQYRSAKKDIDILAVGSMIPVKQQDVFISIVGQVKAVHPHLKVVLVGQGQQMKQVQELVRKSDLGGNIQMPGELPREEVLQLMSESRMLIHTARYEGQGYVLLEALALGIPVVAFDVGFLPNHELVHICMSEKEVKQQALNILAKPADHSPFVPVTIQATVDAYWQQYT